MSKPADLGQGLLTGAAEDLLTIASNRRVSITSITLCCVDTANQVCNVYLQRSAATKRRITPKDLICRPGQLVILNDGYTLGSGDKITADSASANVIEWTISGDEDSG